MLPMSPGLRSGKAGPQCSGGTNRAKVWQQQDHQPWDNVQVLYPLLAQPGWVGVLGEAGEAGRVRCARELLVGSDPGPMLCWVLF